MSFSDYFKTDENGNYIKEDASGASRIVIQGFSDEKDENGKTIADKIIEAMREAYEKVIDEPGQFNIAKDMIDKWLLKADEIVIEKGSICDADANKGNLRLNFDQIDRGIHGTVYLF